VKQTFRTIVLSLLLFPAVSSLLRGQAADSPSSNAPAGAEETPAQVRADESKDPRLQALSAADQKTYLDEGARSIQYCSNNVTLNGFYSCSCFSEKAFDARMKTLGHTVKVAGGMRPTPFTNLIFNLDISACVAPAKISVYAIARTNQVLQPDPTVSPAQRDQISACVSSQLTTSFEANPTPNADAISGLFNTALISCRKKIMAGTGN
jgi:hypothetical protein